MRRFLQVVELQEGLVQHLVHVQVLLLGVGQLLWKEEEEEEEELTGQTH